jgi:non-homologous end joining protein Ku
MQDKTDLVAHSEHIADDVDAVFENDNLSDSVKEKIAEMIETYIASSIETVLENPEWFTDTEE